MRHDRWHSPAYQRQMLITDFLCRGGVVDFAAMVAQGMAQGAPEGAATSPPRSPKAGARRKVKAGRKTGKAALNAAASPSLIDSGEGALQGGLAVNAAGQRNPAVSGSVF